MHKNIYVDFDDVICETARDLSALADKLYGIKVPYPEISAFDLHEAFGLNDDQYHRLMAIAHSRKFVLGYKETPGASETLNKWIDEGFNVEIVTGRPFVTASASREWLDAHGLSRLPVIHVDKYGREPPPTSPDAPRALSVAEFALRHYDFAVEDSPTALAHLEKLPNCITAVFARPWNAKIKFATSSFIRCENWLAVDNLLVSEFAEFASLRS